MMVKKLLTPFILLIALVCNAQHNAEVAFKQIEMKAYKEALNSFQKMYNHNKYDLDAKKGMALSLYYNNEPKKALPFFEELWGMQERDLSLAFPYGKALMMTKKYDEAIEVFKEAAVINASQSLQYISSCEFAKSNAPTQSEKIDRKKPLGAKTVRLVSNSLVNNVSENWIDQSGNKLLNQWNKDKNPLALSGSKEHLAFHQNGKSYHGFISNQHDGSIFFSQLINGNLDKLKAFNYNQIGVSNIDPFITPDGKTLYFSSNREGGFGEYDLYRCDWVNNTWSEPKNLGANINTSGSEISPFVTDNQIFFASDYHLGFGGFDVFKATQVKYQWLTVVNLGSSVNTSMNEVYPCFKNDKLYVTSDQNNQELAYATDYNLVKELIVKEETPKSMYIGDYKNGSMSSIIKKDEYRVNESDLAPPAYSIPSFESSLRAENDLLTMDGAFRVSVGNVITKSKNPIYFIQIAALHGNLRNFDLFRPLTKFGNIYKVYQNGVSKYRLGYFTDQNEATATLAKVKATGFRDAFIVNEIFNTAAMELVLSTYDSAADSYTGTVMPSTQGANNKQYKVRLASYEDPIWFEINKVKDLGQIEQWSKGAWTIFLLSGYKTFEDAEKTRIQAVNRGFAGAEVVIDNAGVIERIKRY